MQVSERVIGFREKQGKTEITHVYGPDSTWSQRPITRFFETTGVCWHVADLAFPPGAAEYLLDAFCGEFSVQPRDLGIGAFLSVRGSPLGPGRCEGLCIYDATHGSLRLTQQLVGGFAELAAKAAVIADAEGDPESAAALTALAAATHDARPVETAGAVAPAPDAARVVVIARGARAIHLGAEPQEVTVEAWRYTPQGLVYDLASPTPGVRWTAAAATLQPIVGETTLVRVDLMTGEEEAAGVA
jgi:hypothetical protein